MKIGDQTISRADFPGFTTATMNPDHIEQLFQDVLMRNLSPVYQGVQVAQQQGVQAQ